MKISNAIRSKRFYVHPDKIVKLHFQLLSGNTYIINVKNCSLTGLSGNIDEKITQFWDENIEVGNITADTKIVFGDNEFALGRLVFRRVDSESNEIAFSTVDLRLPVDGTLSKFLQLDMDESSNPFQMDLGADRFTIANFVDTNFTNVDLFDRIEKFNFFYSDFKKNQKYAYFFAREASQGARIQLNRLRGNGRNDYIMMGSNDYLGLASHPKLKEAAKKAIDQYGLGTTGTMPTAGTTDLHEKLCERVAKLYRREAAIIYPSGYSANVGILAGILREGDLVIADIISHASIFDGMKLSGATIRFFKHNDMNHLEKILNEERKNYNGCLIATEGIFSMDGTIGNLPEIYKLSRQYDARVFVDQGHCLGVLGKTGSGTEEHFKLTPKVDVMMGLFSKALGTIGGFATGSKELIDWLRVFSRSQLFGTSTPTSNVSATIAAIDILESEPELRDQLQANIKHFVQGLRSLGAPIDPNHITPIIPIEIRDERKLGIIFNSMLEDGVYALPVIYPVVAKNRCRFRFSIRADHSISDLDYVLSSFDKGRTKADFSFSELIDKNENKRSA